VLAISYNETVTVTQTNAVNQIQVNPLAVDIVAEGLTGIELLVWIPEIRD
jgi:hypothetical protein